MSQALDIERWDLQCEVNNKDHHTDLNGFEHLIVRRGQSFNVDLYLRSGSYEKGVSSLDLTVQTGPQPSEEWATRASFGLSKNIKINRWSAAVTSSSEETVGLTISSPPKAPIGRYTLTLGSSGQFEFILLFNPWCPGDAVYLDDEQSLEEYVLSQDGIIFRGSYKYQIPTPWNFGQFENGILKICLQILDMNPKFFSNPGKDCSKRRNPVYVSRVLSAMVNGFDDNGVLDGKWSGGYEGGVSPMFWRGSVEILQKWETQQCQPVRYGQCWVFAAVACSISRALGIPCRVVTNYLSAHDSNSNLVIERYIDEKGQLVKSREMIWNYHCWVEGWMTRPDLTSSDFNGWQAFDPTPQERSDKVYCCGPIPVQAIKEGELTFKYDAPFVFAEVNADVLTFMKKKDGNTTEVKSTSLVGQMISTKRIGSDAREDITHLYKFPEDSEEERETFKKANHQNKLRHQKEDQDLHLTIKVSPDMKKGCDFDVFALVTNNTTINKKCRLLFGSCAMSYSGVLGENCGFKDLLNVELAPGASRQVALRLNYSKYGNLLTEDNLIRLGALLFDYTSDKTMLAVRNIVLETPTIEVRILGEPKENRKLAAELTLKNPLPEPLENCCFTIEGANLTGGSVISERLNCTVGPGEDAKVKIYFTPSHSGLRKLVVDFDSNKLCHVKGYKNVIIGK